MNLVLAQWMPGAGLRQSGLLRAGTSVTALVSALLLSPVAVQADRSQLERNSDADWRDRLSRSLSKFARVSCPRLRF